MTDTTLEVVISADADPLLRTVDRARDAVQKFGDDAGVATDGAAKDIERNLTRAGDTVAKWATGMAAAAAAAAAAMVTSGLSTADAMAKQSRAMDATTTGLQGLVRAAGRAGVAQNDITTAAARLNAELGRAKVGSGEAASALDAIGLSADALIGMDVDQRFAAISDAMVKAGMSAAEMGATLRNLGIRQASVIGLMRDGGDAIRVSRDALDAYGATLSSVQTGNIEAANDAFGELLIIQRAATEHMAARFAPIIKDVSDSLARMVVEAGGVSAILDQVADAARIAGAAVVAIVGGRMVAAMTAYAISAHASFTASMAATAGLTSMTAATTAATAAKVALNRVMAVGRGLMGIMGGPAGLIGGMALALGVYAATARTSAANTASFSDRLAALRGDAEAMRRTNLQATIKEIGDALSKQQKELERLEGLRGRNMTASAQERIKVARDEVNTLNQLRAEAMRELDAMSKAGSGGVGGATGITDEQRRALADRIEVIRKSLRTETEAATEEYNHRLAALNQAEAAGLEMVGGYQAAREEMAAQHKQRIEEIAAKSPEARAAEEMQRELSAIAEGLKTREQLETEAHARRRALIDQAHAAGIEIEGGYQATVEEMEAQHRQRLEEIRASDPAAIEWDQIEARLAAITQGAQSELDIIMGKQDTEMAVLQAHYERGIISLDEYLRRKTMMETAHIDEVAAAQKKAADNEAATAAARQTKALNDTRTYLNAAASLMQTSSRRAFEVGKAAAISSALISTYQGAAQALKDVRFPFNFAAAAAVVAAGYVQIRNIRSTSFGGGGGGASAPAAPSFSSGGTGSTGMAETNGNAQTPIGSQAQGNNVAPTQVISIRGIEPQSLYSGQALIELAEALVGYQRRGGVVVLN